MKIGNTPDKAGKVTGTGHQAAGETAKAGNAAAAAPDASATVALSSTASTLLSGGATSEFDTAKVERISKAIADGKYTVNPEVIADKLIANAHELLGKTQR
jgi:negative regulator of flagellin synthesis FlgM